MQASLFNWASWKTRTRALKSETLALYFACRDARVPWHTKVIAACVVAYAFSPVDLIPDFIPVLGYLDDLILVPLGIAWVIKRIPTDVLADCREKAAAQETRPTNWFAGALIIAVWVLLAVWSGRALYRAVRR